MILALLFCCKNDLHTLFLSQKLFMHFFVTKRIYAYFLCRENNLHAFFVAKTIYALRPESFCALKVAIRKVQTFWASALLPHKIWRPSWCSGVWHPVKTLSSLSFFAPMSPCFDALYLFVTSNIHPSLLHVRKTCPRWNHGAILSSGVFLFYYSSAEIVHLWKE